MKRMKWALGVLSCTVVVGLSQAQEPAKKDTKTLQPTGQPVQPGTLQKVEKKGEIQPVKAPEKAPAEHQAPEGAGEFTSPLAPEHAYLKQFVGTWKAEVSMFTGGPEASKSEGTATFTSVFDGRYVISHFEGSMMGSKFQGHQLVGFNTNDNKFESLWIDSMATGFFTARGTADSTGKVITITGDMDTMGGEKMSTKQVTTFTGTDTMTWELNLVANGKEEPMMKIVYTRTKDAGEKHDDHAGHDHSKDAKPATKPAGK